MVNYLQTIAFQLKINTLSPKGESGYLIPEWVFAPRYVFLNRKNKTELFENGGNSSFKAQAISPKVNLLITKQRILLREKTIGHLQKKSSSYRSSLRHS